MKKRQLGGSSSPKSPVMSPRGMSQIDRAMSSTKDEDKTNNMRMKYEVKHFLTDNCTFPNDLVTDKYVELFLKNRAKNHNRKKYTIRGKGVRKDENDQVTTMKDEKGKDVWDGEWDPSPDGQEAKRLYDLMTIEMIKTRPTEMVRLLKDAYEPFCVDCINNLDIYTLPSFNLNNLDDMLRKQLEDNLMDGITEGVSNIGGMVGGKDSAGDDCDIDVDAVFEKWDKNGSKKLEQDEFLSAIHELAKLGIDFDLDDDGDITEEVDILFDILDDDDDMYITYEEFAGFVEEYRARDEREAMDPFCVFDWHPLFGPFVFVFVYILYGMSVVTQFMIPIMITRSYFSGTLGEGGSAYMAILDAPGGEQEALDNPLPGTDEKGNWPQSCNADGQVLFGNTTHGVMCGGPHYWAGICPNSQTGNWDIKLSGFCLFLFLLIATPVADLVASIYAGGEDEEYFLLQYSRFCEDTFFKKTAPVINLLCFGSILITTYLLFMSAPMVDQLLLNVIAVNFLIEVDNIAITTVIDDRFKERMVAKMVLWYIVEGEKNNDDMKAADFYYLKLILGMLFGKVMGWVGIVVYMLSWFIPFVVYACM